MATDILALWKRLQPMPGGRWLFTRLVCLKAPYFASIAPHIEVLEPGRGVARMHQRRRTSNHLGTVHAIAMCNLAELIGGLTCDASLPPGMRWIPKGMQVQYLKKARGTLVAEATPAFSPETRAEGYPLPMRVAIRDMAGEIVMQADIAMWLSPRPRR